MNSTRKNALMVLGTASHVGKSILTAGLCRIFSDAGYRVAPFKAQNMSLNSAATFDGGEIGRAQALQAEACRVLPSVEMNPVLLKPSTDTGAQVILLGKIFGQVSASDYHTRRVEQLFPEVLLAYKRLSARHDLVLLEGAGSPAEINLREHDIVNMRMAHAADAVCLLVGDIDRGGVFASLLGTLELLSAEDRARIRGFIINKFRGDESLLRPGIEIIEKRLGLPCVGVVPFIHHLGLDEEDGVAVEDRASTARRWKNLESGSTRALRVGVIALPHMANFTDFDPLALEPAVSLAYLQQAEEMAAADLLVLPGTKQTLDDLRWLKDHGFAQEISRLSKIGVPIIGICGGFQMLGLSIEDPHGTENQGEPCGQTALGLLPVRTVLRSEKTVQRIRGCLRRNFFWRDSPPQAGFEGYEIHLGETLYETGAQPLATIERLGTIDTVFDGAVSESGPVFGTYVHGIFDNDNFRHVFIRAARAAVNLAPVEQFVRAGAERQTRIDRLADQLRKSLNMNLLTSWLAEPGGSNHAGPSGHWLGDS
ncbi:MAG TPA: cobyric acid synthase [Candidatus Binatia bacterium]